MIITASSRIANPLARWSPLALVLGAMVIGAGTSASASPATLRIDISKFAFEPMEVTVAPGTKIIWTNKDETPHTVTGQMVFPMHIDRVDRRAGHAPWQVTAAKMLLCQTMIADNESVPTRGWVTRYESRSKHDISTG